MTTNRRARWRTGLGILLIVGLVAGIGYLQSMREELQAARASLAAAQASVDTVTGRLQDVRNALAAARTEIDAIDRSIGALDRQTAQRSALLDARIRVLRTRVQHADRQLMQQIHRLAADSLSAPVYLRSGSGTTGRFTTLDSVPTTSDLPPEPLPSPVNR